MIVGIVVSSIKDTTLVDLPGEKPALQYIFQSMEIARAGTDRIEYYLIPKGSDRETAMNFIEANEPWEVVNG
jgi:hypothetical protein